MNTDVVELTVRFADQVHVIPGREAFALDAFVERGETGVTPLTWVGPRWSDYSRKLRLRGFDTETVSEQHDGPYAGRHGRYVLQSPVTVLRRVRAGENGWSAA
jgi:hypothetical protein